MNNWSEIRKAASDAGFSAGWMNAEINASDTVHVEKSFPVSDFDKIALASLCQMLAYGELDKAEHDFYVALGVKF
jgi:hypothetical protein